jgi:hypothetical protein
MTDPQPHNEEVKEVPVEVITSRGKTVKTSSKEPAKTFFHPWSGITILAIDWIAFGMDVPTGFILTPLVSIAAYIATYIIVYKIQVEQNHDTAAAARRKAMIGAIAAAVPFPVTGTIIGVGILMLSGLPTSIRNAAWQIGKKLKKP